MAGKLKYACGYLSGPMEFVADHGVEWRRKFIKLSLEAGLEIDYIDPTNKPGGEDVKIGENKEFQVQLQREGRWKELQAYVHKYRRYDLRYVDHTDFIVAVVDPRVPQWGTADEVYFAESMHHPKFFICDGGLHKLPRWLFDVIDLNDDGTSNVYQSVEEVIDVLVKLDNGDLPLSDEWVLLRRFIEENRVKSRS